MRVQDSGWYTAALMTCMVGLTYGLPVPPHVCVYGDVTLGGLTASLEHVGKSLLDACVRAQKTVLVLPHMSIERLEQEVGLEDVCVYQETLKVGWQRAQLTFLVSTHEGIILCALKHCP